MGTVNRKQGNREDKRPRQERRDVEKRLGQQVRRADRKGLTFLQHLILLLTVGQ
jgi:hypothetical protein